MAIDLKDIKKMPPKVRLLVVCLIFFIVGYFYWFYFLSSALAAKSSLTEKLAVMEQKIAEKTKIANQINQYKADVAALKDNYKLALQKLPDQREIPTLFHSVASAGKDAGVEFILFEPKASIPKMLEKPQEQKAKPADQKAPEPPKAVDRAAAGGAPAKKAPEPAPEPFYEEIPVGVSVMGTYQNILYFFDKVAKLSRIVNVSDITVGDRKEVKGKGFVVTSNCTIKTYMFIEKKEKPSEQKNEKK